MSSSQDAEHIRDLETQLALAHLQNKDLQTAHTEKLEKLKQIFTASTTTVKTLRARVEELEREQSETKANAENELKALSEREDEKKKEEEKWKGIEEENKRWIEKEGKWKKREEELVEKIEELIGNESALKTLQEDYDSYKARANVALQANRKKSVEKSHEEQTEEAQKLLKLEKEKTTALAQLREVTNELRTMQAEITALKEERSKMEEEGEIAREEMQAHASVANQLSICKQDYAQLQARSQKAIHDLEAEVSLNVEQLASANDQLKIYNSKIEQQDKDKEHLTTQIQELKQEIKDLRSDISRLMIPEAALSNESKVFADISFVDQNTVAPQSVDERPRETLSDLLQVSDGVKPSEFTSQPTDVSTSKLVELEAALAEAEESLRAMVVQEKFLKEEIRNADSANKRADMSKEMFKNVVIKFFEATDKEPMIPIISQVLHLSPAEVSIVRNGAGLNDSGWLSMIPFGGVTSPRSHTVTAETK